MVPSLKVAFAKLLSYCNAYKPALWKDSSLGHFSRVSCLPERPDLPFSLWARTFRHLLLQAVCAPSIDTALLIDLGRDFLSCLPACFPCLLLGNCLYLWNLPSEEASFPTCICFDRVCIWGFSWCFWSQYCFSLILLASQYSWQVVPKVCLVNPWESLETFLGAPQVKIIFFFVLVCYVLFSVLICAVKMQKV